MKRKLIILMIVSFFTCSAFAQNTDQPISPEAEKESAEIKKEILQGYKIILPVAAACGLVIYLLRDFIIGVLFTSDFSHRLMFTNSHWPLA